MKVYTLADPAARKQVNLTKYEETIRNAVKEVNPNLQVIIEESSYAVSDDISRGECIKLGRAIAKTELGQFCINRPILFVGHHIDIEEIGDEDNVLADAEDIQ